MNTKLHALADANGRPLSFFMTAVRSATTPARRRCWTTCPRRSGCLATAATTPIGSGMRSRPRASSPASQAADHAMSPSDTISAAIAAATASRSCSAALRIGAASPPATTAAPPSSSRHSPSPPPSSSGCDQRVLNLRLCPATQQLAEVCDGTLVDRSSLSRDMAMERGSRCWRQARLKTLAGLGAPLLPRSAPTITRPGAVRVCHR